MLGLERQQGDLALLRHHQPSSWVANPVSADQTENANGAVPASRYGSSRCLLANAETGEDSAQQIIGTEFAGDAAQGLLSHA